MLDGSRRGGNPPHSATLVQRKAPHPATVVQPKPAPHPATIAQPKPAPHPATIARLKAPSPAPVTQDKQAPHAATVMQRKAPHPATSAQRTPRGHPIATAPRPPHVATVADPARHPAVAQRAFDPLWDFTAKFQDPKPPEDVEPMQTLKDGVGVGYDPNKMRVILYFNKKAIAHVEIQQHGTQVLSLHTGTDQGSAGGNGYLTYMLPTVLRVVSRDFATFTHIDMAPSVGAATKGLISQMARLRLKIAKVANDVPDLAQTYLDMAERWRAKRRAQGKKEKDAEKLEAQSWNDEMMAETAAELKALYEMENRTSTGLAIFGMAGENGSGNLVGTYDPEMTAASVTMVENWYSEACIRGVGVLSVRMAVNQIGSYIAVL